jgi:hypothetical protein
MIKYHAREVRFFKDMVIKNMFPELKDQNSIVVSDPISNQGDGFFSTQVTVQPSIHSPVWFAPRRLTYDRFKLRDYKKKSTDEYLEVPAIKAKNPRQLVNYMNEIYLHSTNVRETKDGHDIYRGFQIGLKIDNLQAFVLNFPAPGNTLRLDAVEGSFLFEGNLLIKFV